MWRERWPWSDTNARKVLLGTFSNDDHNENIIKQLNWFDKQNNYARTSRFFVHFFAVTARLKVMLHDTILNDDF